MFLFRSHDARDPDPWGWQAAPRLPHPGDMHPRAGTRRVSWRAISPASMARAGPIASLRFKMAANVHGQMAPARCHFDRRVHASREMIVWAADEGGRRSDASTTGPRPIGNSIRPPVSVPVRSASTGMLRCERAALTFAEPAGYSLTVEPQVSSGAWCLESGQNQMRKQLDDKLDCKNCCA